MEPGLVARDHEVCTAYAAGLDGAGLITLWGPTGAGTTSVALAASALLGVPASRAALIEHAHRLDALERAALRERLRSSEGPLLATSTEPLGLPGERAVEVAPLGPDDAAALIATCHGMRADDLDAASFGGLPKLIVAGARADFLAVVDAMYGPAWNRLDARAHTVLAYACGFEDPIDPDLLCLMLEDLPPAEIWSQLGALRRLGVAAQSERDGAVGVSLPAPFRRFVERRTSDTTLDAVRARYVEVMCALVEPLARDAAPNPEARLRIRRQRRNVLAAIGLGAEPTTEESLAGLVSVFHRVDHAAGLTREVDVRVAPLLTSAHPVLREAAWVSRAVTERFRGEHASASRALDEALRSARDRGAARPAARITAQQANLDLACGRWSDARARVERVLGQPDVQACPRLLAELEEPLTRAELELGGAASAALELQRLVSTLREAGDDEGAATRLIDLARAHADLRRDQAALDVLSSALQLARPWQLDVRASAEALRARVLATRGEGGAQAAALRAEHAANELGRADLRWHCAWVRVEVDLLEGRRPPRSDLEVTLSELKRLDVRGGMAAHVLRLHAVASLIDLATPDRPSTPADLEHEADPWLRLLAQIGAGEGAAVEAALADGPALPRRLDDVVARILTERVLAMRAAGSLRVASVVGRDGAWFQQPGGARVDLADHPSLKRFLAGLVERHHAGVATVLGSTWPADQVPEATARKRVQVVASRLRKLGLRDLIFRGDDYSLPRESWWIMSAFEDSREPDRTASRKG